MRPVLIGIAPSGLNESGQPLSCMAKKSTGARLQRLLGLTRFEYLENFDRVNVCPTTTPGGIDPSLYRPHAENLMGSLLRNRRVIMLGPNVASCFGIRRNAYSFCETYRGSSSPMRGLAGWRLGQSLPCAWSVIPHPSGRNYWYNDEENCLAVKIHIMEALRECSSQFVQS